MLQLTQAIERLILHDNEASLGRALKDNGVDRRFVYNNEVME